MKGKIIYITIAAIIGASTVFYESKWYCLLFMIFYLYYIFLQSKQLLILCLITITFFSLYSWYYNKNNVSHLREEVVNVIGEIVTLPKINGDQLSFQLSVGNGERIQLFYKIKSEMELNNLKSLNVGQLCLFEGELVKPEQARNYYSFDYKRYLFHQKIHWIFHSDHFSMEQCFKQSNHPLNLIKNWRKLGIEFVEKQYSQPSAGIIQALLFGEKSYVENEVIKSYQRFGIIHLLAISGLHVGLLTTFFFFFAVRLGCIRERVYSFLLVLLPIYMLITGASPSVLRACLMSMVVIIFLKFRTLLHPLDGISISMLILLLYRPYYIFDIGFQLSYIVSLSLILSAGNIFKKYTSKSMQLVVITIIAQLSSFPIIIYNFYEISILSIPLNLLFVPLVSLVILPLSIIITIIIALFPSLLFLTKILIFLIEVSNDLLLLLTPFSFTLALKKPFIILVFLYYIVIIFLFFKWEERGSILRCSIPIVFLFILILVHWCTPYFTKSGTVTILDVGQGDSIVIELPFRKAIYLIDTGGIVKFTEKAKWQQRNSIFEVGEDIIVPFLKARGITKLDKVILTHGDFDHIGGSTAVIRNFKIEKILLNKTNKFTSLEKEILQQAIRKNIEVVGLSSGQSWNERGTPFFVLAPDKDNREIREENDHSVVLFTKLGNLKWIFMGDLELAGENKLLRKYPSLRADVVKIGHHGSNTSSTDALISQLNPKVALISAGKNNRYGHPNEEVLDRLDAYNIRVYRTDLGGAIQFIFNEKTGTFQQKIP